MADNSNSKPAEGSVPQGYQQPGAGIYFVPVPPTQPIAYPYLQGMQPQPQQIAQQQIPQQKVYYQQTTDFIPLNESAGERTSSAPQSTPATSNNNCNTTPQGGCQRRWGWRRCGSGQGEGSSCCMKADPHPQGEFSDFFWNMVFGSILPIFAPLVVFAFESTQMSRIGSLYGTGNFFFVLAISLFHGAAWIHKAGMWVGAGLSLFLAIIFFIAGCKKSWGSLYQYKQAIAKNKAEAMSVVSPAGKCCEFIVSFFCSLLFPIIGTLFRLACSRSLQSRFGALKGLAWLLIIISCIFALPPILLLGLYLLQSASIHFRRAIATAEANEPLTV